MNTNKDILFTIIVILWVIFGFINNYYFTDWGLIINNFIWILLMATLIIIKNNNNKFEKWLNQKF
jgi:hypothetical protein